MASLQQAALARQAAFRQDGMPVYVLGVGLSHNGAACLIRDGRIIVAIEKERLTKRKNDGGNDGFAIDYCLRAAGISADQLALIVQNANFGGFAYGNDWYDGARALPAGVPVVTLSHHLAHAWGAFALSPFETAAILIVDGCGNAFEDCTDLAGADLFERPEGDLAALYFEKDSYYQAGPAGLSAICKDFSPYGRIGTHYPMHPPTTRHSIGGLYAAASTYVFGDQTDAGKLMGLAPYGRRDRWEHRLLEVQGGRLSLRYDWIADFTARGRSAEDFQNRFSYFADIAALVQQAIEEALLEIARDRFARFPASHLCFAGGVALNAVANRRLLLESPFDDLFVPPAADDSGLAVGAAFYGWQQMLGNPRVRHDGSPFLGRPYPIDLMEQALRTADRPLRVERPADLTGAMADALAAGQVVGWFRGGSEFGPRALGHRSILADPRRAEMRDHINRRIKFREDFRPFAPAVPAEAASRFFDLDRDSPYMLRVVPVRPEWRPHLAAVTHVDGSARVQTVRRADDPDFHRLLGQFGQRTGTEILLNTSLNRKGQPIIETPVEAVRLLLETDLDALAIGPFLVHK